MLLSLSLFVVFIGWREFNRTERRRRKRGKRAKFSRPQVLNLIGGSHEEGSGCFRLPRSLSGLCQRALCSYLFVGLLSVGRVFEIQTAERGVFFMRGETHYISLSRMSPLPRDFPARWIPLRRKPGSHYRYPPCICLVVNASHAWKSEILL